MKTMTTAELADFFGVSKETVRRAAKKLLLDAAVNGKTRQFTFEEVEKISRVLFNKVPVPVKLAIESTFSNVAGEPSTNVKAGSVLTDRDFQMIAQIVSVAVSETMKAYDVRMKAIEEKVDRVPLIGYDETHMTVLGFCKANGITVSISGAIAHGKEAARISREEGMSIKRVPDERFGSVNSYHKAVLQKVFSL